MRLSTLVIRKAKREEISAIQSVVKSAFFRPGKDELFNEWTFIENIIYDVGYIDELSIVATVNEEVVGYVILTRASIDAHQGLSLGPIAVKPKYQSKGIGRKLIDYSVDKARTLNYKWIALTGGDYYLDSGFEPAEQEGIILSEGNPENMFLKILFLKEESKGAVRGKMKFCESFYNEKGELL